MTSHRHDLRTVFLHSAPAVWMLLVLVMGVPCHSQAQHMMDANRHIDTPYTNAELDEALAEATAKLYLDDDRCADCPCTATFQRQGSVGTFGSHGDGFDIIDTQAELTVVFAQAGWVKVVTQVNYCAGEYNPSFNGCGMMGSNNLILESGVGGQVYAHEAGHNFGLGHRDDCTWNIMHHMSQGGANDAVNSSECSAFGGRVNTELAGDVWNGNGGPLTAVASPYWVTADVHVPASRTLTILPNVEIQFKHDHQILVDGTLEGDGTLGRILLFSNSPNEPRADIDGEIVMGGGGSLIMR